MDANQLATKFWALKITWNNSLARLNDLVKEIDTNARLKHLQESTGMIKEARETETRVEGCINTCFRRAMISAANKAVVHNTLKKDPAAPKSMHTSITEIETHVTTYHAKVERIGNKLVFEMTLETTP